MQLFSNNQEFPATYCFWQYTAHLHAVYAMIDYLIFNKESNNFCISSLQVE